MWPQFVRCASPASRVIKQNQEIIARGTLNLRSSNADAFRLFCHASKLVLLAPSYPEIVSLKNGNTKNASQLPDTMKQRMFLNDIFSETCLLN